MTPEKTHTNQKKILLYELQNIIKQLYPKASTKNPYRTYLENYYQDLSIHEQLLFKNILASITLLNQKERQQDGNAYLSSYSDILTTIELFSNHNINTKFIEIYHNLEKTFKTKPFTKLEAGRMLKRSQSSIRRYFTILKDLQLLKKTNQQQGSKHLYQLTTLTETTPHYQEAIKDYTDYQGYIDLQYRT